MLLPISVTVTLLLVHFVDIVILHPILFFFLWLVHLLHLCLDIFIIRVNINILHLSLSLPFFGSLHKCVMERAGIKNNEGWESFILSFQPMMIQKIGVHSVQVIWVTQTKTIWNRLW